MARMIPANIRPLLKASRALLPATERRLDNPTWDAASFRLLVVRLSPWDDVDRSSAHLILFAESRAALPGAYIDFAFFPDRADRELLAAAGQKTGERLPWFYGIASGRGPADFDLVLVSNAFALELVNLPYLFTTGGIPLRASERSKARTSGRKFPCVLLGGSNAQASGAIVAADGDALVEGIFFGEGEGAIGELVSVLANSEGPLERRLDRARGIQGFWRFRSVQPVQIRRLERSPPPLVAYPVFNSTESGTARLQIAAGCPGLCSFCLEGWERRPYRELPLEETLTAARQLRRNTGADTLEVYAFNFNTHTEVFALLFELGRIFRRVNFMSQRLDILARTQALVRAELAADKRSYTLGVEGISASMRAFYRKGLSEDDLEHLVELLVVPGVRELKLFYIISGFEGPNDLAEFAEFAQALDTRRRNKAPGLRILASAGYLVRIPGTPLGFFPLVLDEKPLRRVADAMRDACKQAGVEFRLAANFDEYLADQLLVAAKDALPWIERAPEQGFLYDKGLVRGASDSLLDFLKDRGDIAALAAEKGPDYAFPLPFLDRTEELLYGEYLAARSRRDRQLCLGASCNSCGACDTKAARAFIASHVIIPPKPDLINRLTRLTAAKAAFEPVIIEAAVPESLSGSTAAYKGAWLLRLLAELCPGAESRIFEAREALFSSGDSGGLPEGFFGQTLFALYGPKSAEVADAARIAGFTVLKTGPSGLPLRVARIDLSVKLVEGGPLTPQGAALAALKAWLAEERISYTEIREGLRRRFAIAPRDEKKGIVTRIETEEEEGRFSARLSLGGKAHLRNWLDRLGPARGRAASVEVLGFTLGPSA